MMLVRFQSRRPPRDPCSARRDRPRPEDQAALLDLVTFRGSGRPASAWSRRITATPNSRVRRVVMSGAGS